MSPYLLAPLKLRSAAAWIVLALWSFPVAARDVHVSPSGNDRADGSVTSPVHTLTRARDLLREKGGAGNVIVLAPGVFELTSTLELSERDSGLTLRGAGIERTFVTGGREVPGAEIKALTDPALISRLPSERQGRVYWIDLRALGVSDVGAFGPRGFRRPYRPAPLELFIDHRPLHVAQWPNLGEPGIHLGKVIDGGSVPRDGDFSNRGGIFEWNTDRPQRWREARDAWLTGYFNYGYADDTVRIASIDFAARTFRTVEPHMYGYIADKPFNRWHALNLLEELDQPGEYYADAAAGRLFFIPWPGVDLAKARVQVSVLTEPMIAIEGARAIAIENLALENTRGLAVYLERGRGNRIRNCMLRDIGMTAVSIGQGVAPFATFAHDGTGTPASRVLGSWHEHFYANTAFNRHAGTDQGVVGCLIEDTGAGGVSLGGGDRKTLTPAGNFVRNCEIARFNRLDRSYRAGVNIDGVGNRVEHCFVHDAPGPAIYLHGNDHVIAYNRISRTVLASEDMAAVYCGRDPSEQGSVIRYNFFEDNGSEIGGTIGTQAVFADDGACGLTLFGNVFFHTRGQAFKVNQGLDHVVENNVFVDNDAIFQNSWGHGSNYLRWQEYQREPEQVRRLLQEVNILAPPYSTKYPRLVRTYRATPGTEPTNDFVRNAFVRSGKLGANGTGLDRYIAAKDNAYFETDPGFADAGARNFALKPNAEIFRKIPGFQPIPFAEIGLEPSGASSRGR